MTERHGAKRTSDWIGVVAVEGGPHEAAGDSLVAAGERDDSVGGVGLVPDFSVHIKLSF